MFKICAILALTMLAAHADGLQNAVKGKKCAPNQVVNKLTVYEDGAIEAECGPLPCGSTSTGVCPEEAASCKAPTEVFSGMKWAKNGQSLLLRCCPLQAANKVYIGTDLVTLGSYYTGGKVPEQDMMGNHGGTEYDFVANARTEQGGVRVWVYRVVCASQQKQQNNATASAAPQPAPEPLAESNDAQPEHQPKAADQQQTEAAESEPAQNPLQYRPRAALRHR